MTKLMIALSATAAAAGGLAFPGAAAAQQNQSEVVVYGTDPCPRETESNIVVCRRLPETQRYRLPRSMQMQGTRQQRQSWANKSRTLMTAGNTGINSCSAVGPAGQTGCLIQEIQQSRRENSAQEQQDTAPEQ
jgi:hypothetical protein